MKIEKVLDIDNKIYINPKKIDKTSVHVSPTPYKYKTIIVDGDWDIKQDKFVDRSSFFNSFYDVEIFKKKKWEETSYLDKNGEKFLKRKKRIKSLVKIFNDIKNNGWKEIGGYITINIGRNGEILFNDGQHRLTFALSLNLDKIPVKIFMVHKDFYKGNNLNEYINKNNI